MGRLWICAGAANGFIAVALGALASHSLDGLAPEARNWIETGTRYELVHALALLAVALMARREVKGLERNYRWVWSRRNRPAVRSEEEGHARHIRRRATRQRADFARSRGESQGDGANFRQGRVADGSWGPHPTAPSAPNPGGNSLPPNVSIIPFQTLKPSVFVSVAGWAFLLGTVLFSGVLYAMALAGMRQLSALVPLGGVAFLIGWATLFFYGLSPRSR